MRRFTVTAGRPDPLGATLDARGANFAVFSQAASRVEVCLFSPDGAKELARLPLPERTGAVWHGHVKGLKAGALYGLRADGVWAPERGHRFNPAKLLLDPYARAHMGAFDPLSPLLFGHDPVRGDGFASPADSAPAMPKCVLTAAPPPVPPKERPRTPWARTVLYEAHPSGLTMRHPGVPEALRGTYEALGCPAILDHLRGLGVTAIELMPVQMLMDDARLLRMGLRNYWGYNTIGFFAPEPRYFGPNGAEGLRAAIRALHGAGIEVILDVVYNHTAEGDHRGQTLSFRGLDNASYYRLDGAKRHVNDTGCGNTLNTGHPFVLRMVLDSLRYWVQAYGVDGFRFDLATALAREPHGFDPEGGFLDALRQDPVLADVKLIAEPWDIGPGGYRLGGFPPPFAEWNDAFRDMARKFWRREPHAAQGLADRLLGSASLFDGAGRRAWSSVNFVACHDGFTLADVTAYNDKHNQANGEDNRDGHGANYSDNCGAEGPTSDAEILARRAKRRRCMLATVMLAQGTPMLLAGDEIGHSQRGNNNAYCQDNAIGWLDWANADAGLLAFTRRLIALRAAHPALRQSRFLHGDTRPDGAPDAAWLSFEGGAVAWRDPGLARFCLLLRGDADAPAYDATDDTALLAFNGAPQACPLTLPPAPAGRRWLRALDAAAPDAAPAPCGEGAQAVAGDAVAVFVLEPPVSAS